MTYQKKYIKYKQKYLELKNNKMYGGFHDISDIVDYDIYCKDKQQIIPYKKQIIKILDDLQIKLELEIHKKCDEAKPNDKIIDKLDKKYNIINKIKNDNYCDKDVPELLITGYSKIYKDSISKYVNSEDFKYTFENLFFNMSPINFLSKTFYPITYSNFTVYTERTIDGIKYYFEIYKNIINELPIQYYLITNLYTLILTDKPEELIEKKLEFPLLNKELDTHEIYNKNRYVIEGLVLTYDLEKMKNILKMYYLHVPIEFNKWIQYFLFFNISDLSLIHQESFKIMDAFIISNNYNIYFENIYMGVLSLNLGQKIINNSFPLDTPIIDLTKDLLIKAYFKEKISDVKYNIYEDDIVKHPIIEIILAIIDPIKEHLINAYNCGKINYLAKKTIRNTNEYFNTNLAELNKYLKFTRTQILTSIVSELYDELYDFLVLSKIVVPYDLLCILNSIYYYRIYNLPNVKNLINYQSQFSINNLHIMYEPVINSEYEINAFIKNYDIFYRKSFHEYLYYFYNNIAIKIPNYILFKYTEPINKLNIMRPDGRMLNNHPICGEITILNLINLLIVNNDKLNVELLPPHTIPQLVDFYKEYNTLNKLNSNFVINKFANILWKIPFDFINNRLDNNHNIYLHYDSDNKNGVEIRPSYENICRILIYLFNIKDNLNIYNYENGVLKSLNINSNTLKQILGYFNGPYVKKIIEIYEYLDKGGGTIIINLKKFGTLSLNKNHSDYNLSLSNNFILGNLKHYTNVKENFMSFRYDFLQENKYYLHYSYCGILSNDNIFYYFDELSMNNDIGFQFLKNLITIYKYIISYDKIFTILNKFFDDDYETYEIANNRINIFKIIANNQNNYDDLKLYEFNFIKKIILDYNRLGIIFVDTIDDYNTALLLIKFINNCDITNIEEIFPYEISIETIKRILNLNILSFRYFNNLIKKFNLSLFNFTEDFLIKMFENNFRIGEYTNYINILDNISDPVDLYSRFPNLLNNIIKLDNNNTNLDNNQNEIHKINIITILCTKYNYNNIEISNYDILEKLSKLKITDFIISKIIRDGYLSYILINDIIDVNILVNIMINYNLLYNLSTIDVIDKQCILDMIYICISNITDPSLLKKISYPFYDKIHESYPLELKHIIMNKYIILILETNKSIDKDIILHLIKKYLFLEYILTIPNKNNVLLKILKYIEKSKNRFINPLNNYIISIYDDVLIYLVQQPDNIYSLDDKIEYICEFIDVIFTNYNSQYNKLIKNILQYIPNLFELCVIKFKNINPFNDCKIFLIYILSNYTLLEYDISYEIIEYMLYNNIIQCYNQNFKEKIFFIWNKYFHIIPFNHKQINVMFMTHLIWDDDDDENLLSDDEYFNPCCNTYIDYIKNLYKENIKEYQILYDNLGIINDYSDMSLKYLKVNVLFLLQQIYRILKKV